MTSRAAAYVPFRWVAADSVYGVGNVERHLRHWGNGHMLGVDSTRVLRSWCKNRQVACSVAEIAKTLEPLDWKRRSAGEGTKRPRPHDWCYLELADLDAEEFNEANQGLWIRGVPMRRNIDDGKLAHSTT